MFTFKYHAYPLLITAMTVLTTSGAAFRGH